MHQPAGFSVPRGDRTKSVFSPDNPPQFFRWLQKRKIAIFKILRDVRYEIGHFRIRGFSISRVSDGTSISPYLLADSIQFFMVVAEKNIVITGF